MTWQDNIQAFCSQYNIPIEHLADTLKEPKVVPMIRGKAFEFTVLERLRVILPEDTWTVQKDIMNAQLGTHDEDVTIMNNLSERRISVECKLAGKGRFKKLANGNYYINVKCMRSRTLGAAMIERLAPQLGISTEVLGIHNDQYRSTDFDLVVTSIGNAFYETDEDGLFIWAPDEDGEEFLGLLLGYHNNNELQQLAFNKMYVNTSANLSVGNGMQTCVRRKCTNQNNCGFIPNYPPIVFNGDTLQPINGWIPIESIQDLLLNML